MEQIDIHCIWMTRQYHIAAIAEVNIDNCWKMYICSPRIWGAKEPRHGKTLPNITIKNKNISRLITQFKPCLAYRKYTRKFRQPILRTGRRRGKFSPASTSGVNNSRVGEGRQSVTREKFPTVKCACFETHISFSFAICEPLVIHERWIW